MKNTFVTINHALGFARFKDADVKRELIKLLSNLESDLQLLDYEPSSTVEESVSELADTLSDIEKQEADEIIVEVPSQPKKVTVEVEVEEEEEVEKKTPPVVEVEEDDAEKLIGREKPEVVEEDDSEND